MMLKVLRISGQSLTPEYQEGDYVVVASFWRRPSPGDVIIFRNEKHGTMIKKLAAIASDENRYFVIGSHPRSIDSHRFGPVDRKDVIGRVIWHIRSS
jgi:phage repressor protein C with HTH and peptisase S24 domain